MKTNAWFIGSNEILVDRAKQRRWDVTLVRRPSELTVELQQLADVSIACDYTTSEGVARLTQLAAGASPSFVASLSESGLAAAARINEALSCKHGVDSALVEATTNKLAFRRILAGQPFNIPFADGQDPLEYSEFAKLHSRRIAKPIYGVGSHGVAFLTGNDVPTGDAMIVETFVDGTEYSVESLVVDGDVLCFPIVLKRLFGNSESRFVERGHEVGRTTAGAVESRVFSVVADMLKCLGAHTGLFHTEIIVDNDGQPFITETHCRCGGGSIPELMYLHTGVDLYDLYLDSMVNQARMPTFRRDGVCSTNFFWAYPRLGQEILRCHPNVVFYRLFPEKSGPIRSSFDRPGYFVVRADTEAEHDEIISELQERIPGLR